jgi:hypothetical protein
MTCPLTISLFRVVDIYKELRRYKSLEDIPADRLAVLKGSNLYAIYMRIANIDQYDFDLFKAIFEYKIFSKYFTIYPPLYDEDEASKADKLFNSLLQIFP